MFGSSKKGMGLKVEEVLRGIALRKIMMERAYIILEYTLFSNLTI